MKLPEVVEASTDTNHECLVRSSGRVTCGLVPKRIEVVERLHGARQISRFGPTRDTIAGILPDGSLAAESLIDGEPRTFAEAEDLVALAPGNTEKILYGIRRDGRVFAWEPEREGSVHHRAREIVLPDPRTVGSGLALTIPLPPVPKRSLPRFCDARLRIVLPVDVGSLAEVLDKTLGSNEGDYRTLCNSISVSRDCPENGPWFVQHDDDDILGELALVVPLGDDRFGRIPELGWFSAGTEEKSRPASSRIRSSSPVDAWLLIEEQPSCATVTMKRSAGGAVGTTLSIRTS